MPCSSWSHPWSGPASSSRRARSRHTCPMRASSSQPGWSADSCPLAGALANAELGAMYPRAGGDYVYLREAFHPVAGFLVGWLTFFAIYAGTVATLAVGFAASLGEMFGWGRAAVLGIAVVTIVACSALNWVGVRWGALANNVTGWIKGRRADPLRCRRAFHGRGRRRQPAAARRGRGRGGPRGRLRAGPLARPVQLPRLERDHLRGERDPRARQERPAFALHRARDLHGPLHAPQRRLSAGNVTGPSSRRPRMRGRRRPASSSARSVASSFRASCWSRSWGR